MKYLVVLCIMSCFVNLFANNIWIETTQADFSDGFYNVNIYASMKDGGIIEYAPRFDANNDGYIDLVTCDIGGPYVTLFWGDATGYSSNNCTRFSATGAGNIDFADVNHDGYADFLVSHANADSRLAIYWGSSTGPSPNNVFNLINAPSVPNEVCYAADLNKDGYLDIIIGAYYSLNIGAIFWGSAEGYSASNRTELPTLFGAHNTEVADLNSDNWLDIIFINNNASYNYIYWGSEQGFSHNNKTVLAAPTPTPHGVSVADLNNDGLLDLVFTCVSGSQSYVYYNTQNGYQSPQSLATSSTYGGTAINDINFDGHLDIVFFRGWPNPLKPIIFWGSSSGYSNSNTSEIGISMYGSGGYIGDFNHDGKYDIFVNSRSQNSGIFYGPDFYTYTLLNVNRDHHGLFRDIGNVYNRKSYEEYVSSIFDAGSYADWGTIKWDALLPDGAHILFWVRSTDESGSQAQWSDWYPITNGGQIPECLNARYLQYKAHFAYSNPCFLPALNEVQVTYNGTTTIPADVVIKPETINLTSNGKFTAFIVIPGYEPNSIDPATVVCDGAPALYDVGSAYKFIAKFNIQDLVAITPGEEVPLTVTGQLYDGNSFSGTDTVRVIRLSLTFQDQIQNPMKLNSVITFVSTKSNSVKAVLYDITGRVARDFGIIQCRNDIGMIKWDGKNQQGHKIPAGIYFLNISNDVERTGTKIIILD